MQQMNHCCQFAHTQRAAVAEAMENVPFVALCCTATRSVWTGRNRASTGPHLAPGPSSGTLLSPDQVHNSQNSNKFLQRYRSNDTLACGFSLSLCFFPYFFLSQYLFCQCLSIFSSISQQLPPSLCLSLSFASLLSLSLLSLLPFLVFL